MAATLDRAGPGLLHPVHAYFLAATTTLFLGALLSDIAYALSYQIQWINFASWLVAGGLVTGAVAVVFAIFGLFGARRRGRPAIIYLLLLAATWIIGFFNALVHAKDAWAAMPAALVLSVIATALALAASWLGFSAYANVRTGGQA